jgi:hypothetical protein
MSNTSDIVIGLLVVSVAGAAFAYITQNNWRTGVPKVELQLISTPPEWYSVLSRQRTQKAAIIDAANRKLAAREKQGFDDPIVIIKPKKRGGRWLVVRRDL